MNDLTKPCWTCVWVAALTALACLLLTALAPAAETKTATKTTEAAVGAPRQPFDLVRDGKAVCTIVTAETPSPAARLAALELQSHVLKITGVELSLRQEVEATPGLRILVGESAATRALGLRATISSPSSTSSASARMRWSSLAATGPTRR